MSVRDSVERAVTAVPVDGVRLLHQVQARQVRRERRRRWLAAVVATGAVVLAAVLVPFAVSDGESRRPQPASEVPAGQQSVSWHGIQLFVPATWRLEDLHCAQPQADTVVIPGLRAACLPPYVTGLTVVEFTARLEDSAQARDVVVSGHPGRRWSEPLTEEPGRRAVLVLADLNVTVSVRSPRPDRADDILDTAQVVDVDALGCPSVRPAAAELTPSVPGADERVLPGAPERLALCQYDRLQLERSRAVPADVAARVQALLDAGRPRSSSPTPGRCGPASFRSDPLLLVATYPSGDRLQVEVDRRCATRPVAGNGVRQVLVDGELLDVLTSLLRPPRM